MALTDHVAILLGHALDAPRLNKKKTRSDYYAQVALPPAAAGEVAALVSAVYPGVPLSSIEVNFKTNAQQDKPFVGVPSDWFILRLATQIAPELFAADGTTTIPNANARGVFFAGMRVRVHSSAWAWKNEFGKSGASFNLHGMMDAGQGGERLQIGGSGAGAAFAAHANPNATPAAVSDQNAQTVATPNTGNPFGGAQQTQAAQTAQGANPFAQAQQAGNSNPFAQSA